MVAMVVRLNLNLKNWGTPCNKILSELRSSILSWQIKTNCMISFFWHQPKQICQFLLFSSLSANTPQSPPQNDVGSVEICFNTTRQQSIWIWSVRKMRAKNQSEPIGWAAALAVHRAGQLGFIALVVLSRAPRHHRRRLDPPCPAPSHWWGEETLLSRLLALLVNFIHWVLHQLLSRRVFHKI